MKEDKTILGFNRRETIALIYLLASFFIFFGLAAIMPNWEPLILLLSIPVCIMPAVEIIRTDPEYSEQDSHEQTE
jgi:hypothetical protein